MASTHGYSGTPLVRKLGLKAGGRMLVLGDVPAAYRSWIEPLPEGARIVRRSSGPHAAVHLFTTRRADLARRLDALRRSLQPNGFVWVSWPKRASGVPTDVTEDVIREVALPLEFVDIKVCAVSEVWSGLKLVIRRQARGK